MIGTCSRLVRVGWGILRGNVDDTGMGQASARTSASLASAKEQPDARPSLRQQLGAGPPWPLVGLALALLAFAGAIRWTPPPGITAEAAYAGLPRLGLY